MRQAVIVQCDEGTFGVRYRERPSWWPWWWLCRWHHVQPSLHERSYPREEADRLARAAVLNGCIISRYADYCRAIEAVITVGSR